MRRLLPQTLRMIVFLLIVLPLAGCWSSIELNDRAFVSLIIVDYTDNGIELTLGIPLTNKLIPGQIGGSSGDDNDSPAAFMTRSGPSLEDALQKIQGDLSRLVTFGQNHSIIVGSRFAERGIGPILEFVTRNPFLRLNTNLFMIEGDARQKVAQSRVFSERFFVSIVNGFVRNELVLNTTVKDLMFSQANGGDGLLPILRFSRTNASLAPNAPPSVGTGGSAILREGKLVKPLLTPEENSAARSVLSELSQYMYSIKSPSDGKFIGFYTSSIATKIRPVKSDDHFKIRIEIASDVGIIASDSAIDLRNDETMGLLESEIQRYSEIIFRRTIAKTQAAGADVFNLASYIAAKYPKEWKQIKETWRDYYKNKLEIEVDATIHLERTGSSNDSFQSKFIQGQG